MIDTYLKPPTFWVTDLSVNGTDRGATLEAQMGRWQGGVNLAGKRRRVGVRIKLTYQYDGYAILSAVVLRSIQSGLANKGGSYSLMPALSKRSVSGELALCFLTASSRCGRKAVRVTAS